MNTALTLNAEGLGRLPKSSLNKKAVVPSPVPPPVSKKSLKIR
jgi:hypothetical protein